MKSLQRKLQNSIKDADKILSTTLGQIKGGTAPIADCQACKAGCQTCQPGNS